MSLGNAPAPQSWAIVGGELPTPTGATLYKLAAARLLLPDTPGMVRSDVYDAVDVAAARLKNLLTLGVIVAGAVVLFSLFNASRRY